MQTVAHTLCCDVRALLRAAQTSSRPSLAPSTPTTVAMCRSPPAFSGLFPLSGRRGWAPDFLGRGGSSTLLGRGGSSAFMGRRSTSVGVAARRVAIAVAPCRRPLTTGGVSMAAHRASPDQLPKYRWLPEKGVYHSHLCVEAKAGIKMPGWEYGLSPPAGTCCGECARMEDAHPRSLAGGKVIDFFHRQGAEWRRDYFAAPAPGRLLGSNPPRLEPHHLVDVSYRIVECVSVLQEWYRWAALGAPRADMTTDGDALDKSLSAEGGHARSKDVTTGGGRSTDAGSPGDRQAAFFIRSGAGWGKTFCLEELMSWVNACSTYAGTGGQARDDRDAELRRRAISAFRDAGVLDFAANTSAYCVNFNGLTAFNDVEVEMLSNKLVPPAFLCHARVCYSELVNSTVAWGDYLSTIKTALELGVLTPEDFASQARDVMRFCRGRPGGIPLLLVDEMAKIRRSPSGADAVISPWAEAVRSAACRDMHDLSGEVLFTTLEYKVMLRETSMSGRPMLPAFPLTYLDALGFYKVVQDVLAPLVHQEVGPRSFLDKIMPSTGPEKSDFVTALCLLLAGHPRYVGFFRTLLSTAVYELIRDAAEEPIFASDVQAACWECLGSAADLCELTRSLDEYGGVRGFKSIAAAVLLQQRVKLRAAAVRRGHG